MSVPRTIGYLGIALLLILVVFGLIDSLQKLDWYGVFVMAAGLCVLAFFGHGLHSAAKREANPALADQSGLGWYGVPVSALFRGPVLHTPEGLALVIGSGVALLFALVAWLAPSAAALNPSRSSVCVAIFGTWPIVLFVIYITLCGPDFRSRAYTVLIMLCAACFPFYLAYR